MRVDVTVGVSIMPMVIIVFVGAIIVTMIIVFKPVIIVVFMPVIIIIVFVGAIIVTMIIVFKPVIIVVFMPVIIVIVAVGCKEEGIAVRNKIKYSDTFAADGCQQIKQTFFERHVVKWAVCHYQVGIAQ